MRPRTIQTRPPPRRGRRSEVRPVNTLFFRQKQTPSRSGLRSHRLRPRTMPRCDGCRAVVLDTDAGRCGRCAERVGAACGPNGAVRWAPGADAGGAHRCFGCAQPLTWRREHARRRTRYHNVRGRRALVPRGRAPIRLSPGDRTARRRQSVFRRGRHRARPRPPLRLPQRPRPHDVARPAPRPPRAGARVAGAGAPPGRHGPAPRRRPPVRRAGGVRNGRRRLKVAAVYQKCPKVHQIFLMLSSNFDGSPLRHNLAFFPRA
jgi:hypothetical protein